MKKKKLFCLILLACLSMTPLFAFIVSDILHTALTEVTQAQSSIKQVAQLQTMISDYKNQVKQIENYLKQIESMDFSTIEGFTNGLQSIENLGNACERTLTNTARNVGTMQTKMLTADLEFQRKKENAINSFQKDLDSKNSRFFNEIKKMGKKDQTLKTYQYDLENIENQISFYSAILTQEEEALKSQEENYNDTIKETIKEFQEVSKTLKDEIKDLKEKQKDFLLGKDDSEIQIMQKTASYNQIEEKVNKIEKSYADKKNELQKVLDELEEKFNQMQDRTEMSIASTKEDIEKYKKQKEDLQTRYDNARKTWT